MRKRLIVEKDVPAVMRDGVRLSADIYRPDAGGQIPVLLQRTPYGKQFSQLEFCLMAAGRGYGVICQDTRGRWASEGRDYPFFHEKDDGYDTVQWAAGLPWSNGRVGMFGGSYRGFTQWAAAAAHPPALKTIAPALSSTGMASHSFSAGGVLSLAMWLSWGLVAGVQMALLKYKGNPDEKERLLDQFIEMSDGITDNSIFFSRPALDMPLIGKDGIIPFSSDVLTHFYDPTFWRDIVFSPDEIDVPVFQTGGWYDFSSASSLTDWARLQKNLKNGEFHQALIGPWLHNQPSSLVGEVDFGMRASPQLVLPEMRQLDWFDYWLKEQKNGVDQELPLHIFVMGHNRWRAEKEWPLARTRFEKFYLHSNGHANSLAGDGRLSQAAPVDELYDSYVYNPHNPVPTRGGSLCCWLGLHPGAYDQRKVEKRPDVLVYSTGRLEQNLEVTGPVKAHLWAATDVEDTDFTAKLVDVSPGGYARNVLDGIIRASYRSSENRSEPVEPGSINEYVIDLGATSNVFLAGHCIRLEISSSNFPRFDRNSNVAACRLVRAEMKSARQRIFHDAERPSHIIMPVIPA